MKIAATILAASLIASAAPAAASPGTTADAGRALTGLLMIRCRDTATLPGTTAQQRKYACNPTGAETCQATIEGETACVVPQIMPSACRLYLHPEWYTTRPTLFSGDPQDTRHRDEAVVQHYAVYHGTGPSLHWLTKTTLSAVTSEASTSSTDCGSAAELKEQQRAKPKPVWACTKKVRGKKRKCHKVTAAAPKPAAPVVTPDDNLAPTTPHHDAAKAYANDVSMLVTSCQSFSLPYATVLQRSKTDAFWTTRCSVLYYDKLKAIRDTYNAQNPDFATPYPSRDIVQQIENAYVRDAGSTANLDCWVAWGSNTAKPLPTGCQG